MLLSLRRFRLPFLCCLLALSGSSSAQDTLKPCLWCALEGRVALKIETITPQAGVVEHDPIDVVVSATMRSLRNEAKPVRGLICIRNQTPDCVQVTLPRDTTIRRTVHARAPAAGAGIRLEAYYCEPTPPDNLCQEKSSVVAEQPLAVAARYELILQAFEILHTRARTRDSVEVSLAAVAGKPIAADSPLCDIVGPPTYCIKPVAQGDHLDGVYPVKGDVRVGPYTLVPETDPDLNLLYIVANHGHSYNERAFLAFMNLMNTFGAGIYGALGQSGGSYLKDATESLNEAMASDCDGIVVSGTQTLLNRTIEGQYASTLEARTRENGFWQQQSDVYTRDNKTNCGDSSKYRVTWRLARTSWQPPLGGPDRSERIVLPFLSDEQGPRYCPRGSAVIEVACKGDYCDDLQLTCARYARETPLGHRDVDAHHWSGWYSEENGGHPPEWPNPEPVTGFVTGAECRGDYCDELRVDTDADIAPQSAGTPVGNISEEDPPARCPAGQFVTKLLCKGDNCDNLWVWCSK